MKKLLALMMAAAITLSLAACSNNKTPSEEGNQDQGEKKVYKVAIVKQMDHASLDEIATAICKQLDVIAEENNVEIQYGEVYSGQGDQSVLKQIGAQVISDGVDAIIPIATTAAQVMTVEAEDTKTPVIFAAVSDPVTAKLTDIDYVTGTSEGLDTKLIMDMILAQNPDVKTVGLLYSKSEPNSETPIAEAKAYLESKNIAYSEKTGNTNDEVVAAAGALVSEGVDAIFTPTDNVVMAAEPAIYETLMEAGIPHYTGADSFVLKGAFATCGVNYTDLGTQTADLAFRALKDGMAELDDYYPVAGGIITVNTETAANMDIDYSVFESMGTIVKVSTDLSA